MSNDPEIDKRRRTVGEARVRAAMDHVQQAQIELGRAMADLSAVIGFIPEGDKLSALYDKVHSLWYKIRARLDAGPTKRYPEIGLLDRIPFAGDHVDVHAKGCGYRGWRVDFQCPINIKGTKDAP